MTDFLIVGRGLAATTAMHALHRRGMSFVTIGDPALSSCSRVAAGIWHPLVFKRLTECWMAGTLIPFLLEFYRECETLLGRRLITERTLVRPFGEEQEKTLWKKKASGELKLFLDPHIREQNGYERCEIQNGYGVVHGAGNLDVNAFISATEDFFGERVRTERFDHRRLVIRESNYEYGGLKAKRILFCEGVRVSENPFFSWVPLRPSKGEILTLMFDRELFRHTLINKGGFLLDIGGGLYKAGATYAWDDVTDDPTDHARRELLSKIAAITREPYSVVAHEAGVRPSSHDRRPIVGEHPFHRGMYILNGLGTRGVMLAPWFATKFVIFCRQEASLEPESDVARFRSLYEAAR